MTYRYMVTVTKQLLVSWKGARMSLALGRKSPRRMSCAP
jgi:hypothetical protein